MNEVPMGGLEELFTEKTLAEVTREVTRGSGRRLKAVSATPTLLFAFTLALNRLACQVAVIQHSLTFREK
jgi:hypothetical protein